MSRADVEADVVIVGTGAGGGVVALALALAFPDLHVVMLEKGPDFQRAAVGHGTLSEDGVFSLGVTRRDIGEHFERNAYSNDELKLGERRLIDQDPEMEPRTFRPAEMREAAEPAHTQVARIFPISSCVGGGTVHYCGVSFRAQRVDFEMGTRFGGIPGAELVDWPMSYEELAPFYTRVERALGISGATGQTPGEDRRRPPYQFPAVPPKYDAKLFTRGAESLGLNPYPTPLALNVDPDKDDARRRRRTWTAEYRARNACENCGHCCGWGCPIGAKNATNVTTIPAADLLLRRGGGSLRILPEMVAVNVVVRKGRATGVEYRAPNARRDGYLTRPRFAAAREAVVVAAGAIETPRLFWLSLANGGLRPADVNTDVLGRFLTAHHFPSAVAYFAEPTGNFKGPWSTRCLDDLYLAPAGSSFIKGGNVQVVAPTAGAGGRIGPDGPYISLGGPIGRAKMVRWGATDEGGLSGFEYAGYQSPFDLHRASMAGFFGHDVLTGMIGEDLPQRRNGVDLDPEVEDIWGLPVARIHYTPHPMDLAAAQAVLPTMGAILEAAGAEIVLTFTITQPGLPPPGVHPMGSMRMGRVPGRARGADEQGSVVNGRGAVPGVPNLFVADGSLMPTATGYNPTLTLQALAWWVADQGVARLLRS